MIKNSFIILLFSVISLAQTTKVGKLLSIIDEEIKEVDRLARQYKGKNPSIIFRKAELYLEKGRVVKEEENANFLRVNPDLRAKTPKKNYFKRSRAHFARAKREALSLLKQFPDYKRSSDVYYILGFNEKEFQNYDAAFEYLKKAEKYAQPGTKSKTRVDNALAEMYYNKNDYSNAIDYYERNIKNESDKWWTKDAYNLAWSYFRVKRYNNAINLMKKVEGKSSTSRYIDMRSQVKKDIGYFFAEAGKIGDGVKHYKKYNQNYVLELIKISRFLEESGKYAQSMTVLNEALDLSVKPENKAKILIARLQLFDKYEKTNYHLKDSIALYKLTKNHKLNSEQMNIFKYQVKRQVGKLQKKVGDKTYQKSKKVVAKKVKQVASYLTLMKGLEPNKAQDSYFYVAETYFQAANFEKAINSYLKAYELSGTNQKIKSRSLEGMLAAIGKPESQFPARKKYYEKVYGLYLAQDSRSAKAQKIYKSLFKLNLDKKNTKEMESILAKYSQRFPRDVSAQEKMVNSLITIYSTSKNSIGLKQLISKVNSNQYKLSLNGKKSLNSINEKLEVQKVETAVKKGDFTQANAGYTKLYYDKLSSKLTKSNAAYNLMALNFKENNIQKTYDWAIKSMRLINSTEFLKQAGTYYSIANFFVEKLEYTSSADISHRSLGKLCASKSKYKNILFSNAVNMYLVSGKISKARELKRLANCGIKKELIDEIDNEILSVYEMNGNITSLISQVNLMDRNPRQHSELIMPSFKIYQHYQRNLMNHKLSFWIKRIVKYYESSKRQNLSLSKESLDAYAWTQIGSLKNSLNRVSTVKLMFPEERFNKNLDQKIKLLQDLTDKAARIQKVGSGLGIVDSYDKIIEGYKRLITEVQGFTPPGKSPVYVKSFKSSMQDIIVPLGQKVKELEKEALKSIHDNKILSKQYSINKNFTYNAFSQQRFFDSERRGK